MHRLALLVTFSVFLSPKLFAGSSFTSVDQSPFERAFSCSVPGWKVIDHGRFKICLPADSRPRARGGSDSEISEEWNSADVSVIIDYGQWADDLTGYSGMKDFRQWDVRLENNWSKYISFTDTQDKMSPHKLARFIPNVGPTRHLSIFVYGKSRDTVDTCLTIARSVSIF